MSADFLGFFWGAGAAILAWLAVEWWRAVHKPEKPIDLGPDIEALRRIATSQLSDLRRLILERLEHSEPVYMAASRYDAHARAIKETREALVELLQTQHTKILERITEEAAEDWNHGYKAGMKAKKAKRAR